MSWSLLVSCEVLFEKGCVSITFHYFLLFHFIFSFFFFLFLFFILFPFLRE